MADTAEQVIRSEGMDNILRILEVEEEKDLEEFKRNPLQRQFYKAHDIAQADLSDESKKIKLYVVVDQELLRHAYEAALLLEPAIEIVGVSADSSEGSLVHALEGLQPDAVLLGTKNLQPSTMAQLVTTREHLPCLGIVILASQFEHHVMNHLRKFTSVRSGGCALLFQHSLDKVSKLMQVIRAVTDGQVILDPVIMEKLMTTSESNETSLLIEQLTDRELEVLSWMAKGYRNVTIAEVLCVEPNTIERHVNSIYNKLQPLISSRNPRVSSTIVYLKATGQLPRSDFGVT